VTHDREDDEMSKIAALPIPLIRFLATGRRRRRSAARPAGLSAVAATVALWMERGRSRRALAALGDHQLKDIGISRADAWQESEKPFWRP
jgi:uncharacterized protein YjiS (DUF1127 family)